MPRLTALHRVVAQGDFEEAQRLLTEGADVNAVADWVHPSVIPSPTFNNITPLHIAACLGHREIAALLSIINMFFLIRLFLSVISWATVCYLSYGFCATSTYSPLRFSLMLTIYQACIFFFFSILYLAFDPLPLTPLPLTPLHLALEYGQDHIVELLLNHGADINQLGYDIHYKAVTPLLIVSKKGNFNIVKLLLEHGALPNSMRNNYPRLASLARRIINNPKHENFEEFIFKMVFLFLEGGNLKFYTLL